MATISDYTPWLTKLARGRRPSPIRRLQVRNLARHSRAMPRMHAALRPPPHSHSRCLQHLA